MYFITVLFYQRSTLLLVFFCDDKYMLSFNKEGHAGGRGVSFFRVSGGLPFPMDSGGLLHMEGVTIRDFPGEIPVLISYPIG